MIKQRISLKCPFCNKGEIEADYIPPSVRFKKGTWGGSKPGVIRSEETLFLRIDKCPSCGKSDKEILKARERGKQVSHEERLKRLQASGLPTKIVNKRE